MQFFVAENVSLNRFPASDSTRSFRGIPRFCALHTVSCARFRSDFTQVTAGFSRVIRKRSYSSNFINPKKENEPLGASLSKPLHPQ